MNPYVKRFLHRGLVFGGFGPLVMGIVYWCLSLTLENIALSGGGVLLAVFSTYLLAFLHAGASVFNQIEHWSLLKSLLCHSLTLYAAYTICYLVNSWIPLDPIAFLIFTAVFFVFYFAIWLSVLIGIRITQGRLNRRLEKK